MNWHINDTHTEAHIKYGTLSTLRQSIASIVAHDQYDKKATDNFIDKLEVEYFFNEQPIKSTSVKNELTGIEKALLQEYLRILNIRDNNHPCAKEINNPDASVGAQCSTFRIVCSIRWLQSALIPFVTTQSVRQNYTSVYSFDCKLWL